VDSRDTNRPMEAVVFYPFFSAMKSYFANYDPARPSWKVAGSIFPFRAERQLTHACFKGLYGGEAWHFNFLEHRDFDPSKLFFAELHQRHRLDASNLL
jgi:hypothetical protein